MRTILLGKAALGLGFAWIMALGTTTFTLSGCSNDAAGERESDVGQMDLALTGTSSSGQVYRLRDGDISISGTSSAEISTEDFVDQVLISLEVPAGGYLASLASGWRLEHQIEGGWEDVRAVLTSTNPLPFTVIDQETTDVRLTFRAGDDVVEFGNGRVHIGIDVDDDATPPPPPGDCVTTCTEAAALGCPNADICFDICENLPGIVLDSCIGPADDYIACAADQPGASYVCSVDGYPIAGACEAQFDIVIQCSSCPTGTVWDGSSCVSTCVEDLDMDGACADVDCNDVDASISPSAPETCGDGIDQDCNGSDAVCAPAGWTCPPQYFSGLDGCDCGCGVTDPDCIDSSSGSCEFCDDPGSCSVSACPGNIKLSDNSICF